ncbi:MULTISPECIES: Mrp/NBP35 family ATP-binding protein [unclassified Clostridium]|uniref:Mrp/NBP35 family ATP-binding protein n=1 Tax=unclassified Clostridium TaxID=2614128 RepID=UPI0025C5AFE7|nr:MULTISPECIES: Mrp/NBP35 family ATP-binding protein [unclassified Clostridium]
MSKCDSCSSKFSCTSQSTCTIENNPHNKIKNIIAVMSGKGGVGKSTMSTMIAKTLNKEGYKVGVLDADITGPSIPRLLKIKHEKLFGNEAGIIPAKSEEGISVMSVNLLMDNEEQPAILRGPVISATVKQFWTDVYWGELDFLIIDMPPGTGDVPLTVMQSVPISGVVIVSTPQDMVSMIVAKSLNMARSLNIPVIGIIENMSYLLCPDCDTKIRIFENENLDDYIRRMNTTLLGELPMCKEIAQLSSEKAEKYNENIEETMILISNKIIDYINNKV